MPSTALVRRPLARPVRRPTRRPAYRPRRRPTRRTTYRPRSRTRRGRLTWREMAGIGAAVVALLVFVPHVPAAAPSQAAAVPSPPAPVTVCTTPGGVVGPVGPFQGQQLVYAAAIVATGKEMDIPESGQITAVATGMTESKLRMYANARVPASMSIPHEVVGADHLSVGLFQQQPWWGAIPVLMDARGSARAFYAALLKVPGWESMPLARRAQAVQRSAYPDRYAEWTDLARAVVAAVAGGITCTTERT